jgi:hypothetical protein
MTRKHPSTRTTLSVLALTLLFASALLHAGPLTPPVGPVAPTLKTLAEVEPRIAINATNTPGDNDASPSLFKITQPGSYYLTGNITGSSAEHGIEIVASNVTLDLRGFEVRGVAGSLNGIRVEGTRSGITVTDGSVTNWGGLGVRLIDPISGDGEQHRVERVNLVGNAGGGVAVGDGSIVRHCLVRNCGGSEGIRARGTAIIESCVLIGNSGSGIDVGVASTVTNCTVSETTGSGIIAADDSTVTGCISKDNGGGGIIVGTGGTVRASTASFNGGPGFRVDLAGVIVSCVASRNGTNGFQIGSRTQLNDSSAAENEFNGVLAIGQCTIRGNRFTANGFFGDGAGIHLTGDDNVVENNFCRSNDRGLDVDGDGNRIESNSCSINGIGYSINGTGNFFSRNTARGNTTNWAVVANNVLFVVDAATAGIVVGSSGGVSPGSTNPNANYSF